MAKLNITTQEALNEIRILIAELENLKKSTVSVNKTNAESFATLDKSLKTTREKVSLLGNQLNYLQAILVKNNQAIVQNASANASSANSEFRVKDAVNTRTQAIIDLNNALRKQKEAQEVMNMKQSQAAAKILMDAEKEVEAKRKTVAATHKNIQAIIEMNNSLRAQRAAQEATDAKSIESSQRQAAADQRALRTAEQKAQAVRNQQQPYNQLVAKQREAQSVLRNLIASEKASNAEIRKAQTEYDKLTAKVNKANGALNKQGKEVKQTTSAFNGLISTFGAYLSLNFALDVFKDVYENIKSFDSLSFAIEKITQNTIDYENSQKFLLTLTEKFGVELLSTANRWIKFLAAAKQTGLALRDTENIFRSVTKASAVLGLQTDELQSVYLALEQMLSKGKVTTEELRRQLGERLPGAMGIMAAAIGKTIPELDTMLKKGEVLSADALPKFALALEQAYGIEHEENIKTLTAEQGRLTAAWQTFIKNVAEGEGVIKKTLGWTLNALTKMVQSVDYLTMDDDQKVRAIAASQEEQKRLEIEHQKALEAVREQGFEDDEDLRDKISKARIAFNKSNNEEEAAAAEAHLNEMLLFQKKANDRKEELLIEYGVRSVDMFEKMYEKELATYNKYQSEMAKPKVIKNLTFSGWEEWREPGVQYRDEDFVDSVDLDSLQKQLGLMEAMYNLSRKYAETSKVKLLGDDEEDKIKKVWRELKNLNEVYDLTREIQMKIAQTNIDANDKLIASDKSTNASRIKLYEENANYRVRIAEIAYEIESEKARIHRDKEIAALELYNRQVQKSDKFIDTDKVESENRTREQIELLNKEYDQKEILAYQAKNDKIFQSNTKLEGDLIKNLKEANDTKLSIVEDPYNKEIIAARKVYEESKKTNRDRIILEKELERVSLESAEAIIRAKIAILKASIDASKQSSEYIESIQRQINRLEASINNLKPGNKDEWIEFWNEILDLASKYNKALGDLVSASFDNRIENINAEIDAETKKYEKLHELAEGDALQQETLRVNKERRIEQLEKKRLKEEQKAAKAKKAFALADIAINTAVAISKVLGQTGIFGLAAWIPVAALGALQAAAVAAVPIPQYKDGGNITKDEIAMINDGNAQEYVKRGDKILTTETKDAIVQLQRGDIVYKNYDEMVKNNNNIPNMYSSKAINENEFNRLLTTVSSGIEKGFKKANINNNIIVKNNSSEYRDSLSIWN